MDTSKSYKSITYLKYEFVRFMLLLMFAFGFLVGYLVGKL